MHNEKYTVILDAPLFPPIDQNTLDIKISEPVKAAVGKIEESGYNQTNNKKPKYQIEKVNKIMSMLSKSGMPNEFQTEVIGNIHDTPKQIIYVTDGRSRLTIN